ncbi:MAG: nitric oxide reductase transcriptional regulator NorR [Vicinamibacteria bacterium]|nr:nitric oxide reductase transcriptional regulator NorR [Vicinamibacteria bacterium]
MSHNPGGFTDAGLEALLAISRDLTASFTASDRYERLLSALRRVIPCDAACLLRLEGEALVPVAGHGLSSQALSTRYKVQAHPRLSAILGARGEAVRFPPDSKLPDPFDGQLLNDPHALEHIHACLGCALTEGGEVVGALTADALEPRAFDELDPRFLATLGALTGAALRTASLIEALEERAEHSGRVARELLRASSSSPLLGASAPVARLLEEIALVGASDLAVLITGETGVGKELVARAIHAASRRRDEPLIQVNCAALPEAIAESELFGHVAGAFTGALRDRAGKFELASGGTLFLDEVGELSAALQPKLLRALQQGEVQRVGSDKLHRVDVRVIAATNRDLAAEVAAGRFRADLYHRLAVYPLHVPPLRERREDVALLAAHFADAAGRRLGLGRVRLAETARERLAAFDWPGNVRELENLVSRAVLRASRGRHPREAVSVDVRHLDLPAPLRGGPPGRRERERAEQVAEGVQLPPLPPGTPLSERLEAARRAMVGQALARNPTLAAAARELGMHRSNLHHLVAKLGLRPKGEPR